MKPPANQPTLDQLERVSVSPDTPSKKKDSITEETGGPDGPEPTRYGDWEKKGRCIDF